MSEVIILADYGGPRNQQEVKPFLRNMFRDRRILSVPSLIRYPLSFLISTLRSGKSRHIYSLIGGSPVTSHISEICEQLNSMQNEKKFVPGFRYMAPFIDEVIKKNPENTQIHVFPTFPHYSFSTYQTIMDVTDSYQNVTVENPFYNDTDFLTLLADTIKNTLKNMKGHPAIMLTAHSVPVSFVKKGDRYISQVEEQVELLRKAFPENKVVLAYQSPLGPVEWVGPFIEDTVDTLTEQGHDSVAVVPLSFTVDNSETMYELDMYLKDYALEKGINHYKRVSCLNNNEAFCRFILKRTGCLTENTQTQ